MLGLVPFPKLAEGRLGKLLHLSAIAGVYGLVLCDTRYSSQLASQALRRSPEFCSMMSCIARAKPQPLVFYNYYWEPSA